MTCGHAAFAVLHTDRIGLSDLVTCVCRRCLHTWAIAGAEHCETSELPRQNFLSPAVAIDPAGQRATGQESPGHAVPDPMCAEVPR